MSSEVSADRVPERLAPDRIGLCLSGGGFRATLFHAGAVWRLSDLGLLRGLHLVSGVSGGSIAAAVLGLGWSQLDFDGDHTTALRRWFIDPLRRLTDTTIDVPAAFRALLDPRCSAGERVGVALARHLFADRTLQDLPERPHVVINATNVQSMSAWQFSRRMCGDARVGYVFEPTIELATAVAASAAYPPFLSPVRLRLDNSDFQPASGSDLQHEPFTTTVSLADAASIDSLGVSVAWEECGTVLISDALRPGRACSKQPKSWLGTLQRTRSILEYHLRKVRVKDALAGFASGARAGAYWEINEPSALATVPGALECPADWSQRLPQITTRLRRLDRRTQEELINWGYAIADVAIRGSLDATLAPPSGFPYPS